MARSPFVHEWVAEHAERAPHAPAIDDLRCRLTYGGLARRVQDLAADLVARGVRPGERIVVALPTSAVGAVAALAAQAAGACAVEVDRGAGRALLASMVEQAAPRRAIVAAADVELWTAVLDGRPLETAWIVLDAAPGAVARAPARDVVPLRPDGSLGAGASAPPRPALPRLREDAPALVLYTSGSTGTPRGVVHTFRNIAANSRSIVAYLGLGPEDRAMAILPFHYTYGRSVLQTHLLAGGSVFVDRRFMFPRVVLEAIGTEGCTGFAGVATTFELLRREVDVAGVSMPRLRYVTQAGGPMRADTTRWARAAFAPARLFVMYGQTEATARLSYVPPERGEEKLGSIGVPIPGVELRVVDDGGGELPAGVIGHLVARGDNVTPGYLAAPEDTAAILRGGWLWTGDLARRDADGFFWLAGRARDFLKVGGHRVSPVEIEEALLAHPAVAEAVVVGTEDPVQGEVAVAFVVLSRAVPPTADEALRRHCRDRLPLYKVPARIAVVDAIPRGGSGKALKPALAARASAEVAARGVPR
jgi:acyl-CoA synthetase (AMP-forming)/AMP-acid ligase II